MDDGEQKVTEPNANKRIGWLIRAHLVLVMAPALDVLIPDHGWFLLLSTAVCALPRGSLMVISVWLGLGRVGFGWRLLTSALAVGYAATWMTISDALQSGWKTKLSDYSNEYLDELSGTGAMVAICAGTFLLARRWFVLRRVKDESMPPSRDGFRFSVFHVLVLMTIVAVILTLLSTIRDNESGANAPSVLGWTADDSLGEIIVLLITTCAAFGALSPTNNMKRNAGLVLLVSVLSGIAIVFSNRTDRADWPTVVADALYGVLSTVVVFGSLLVVRSCGFRLIRRDRLLLTAAALT